MTSSPNGARAGWDVGIARGDLAENLNAAHPPSPPHGNAEETA